MATYLLDLLYSFTNCMCCFPTNPSLKINTRSFKMLRLLGEGGFSYVYLVEDTFTSDLYALKKIRCPFGQESVAQALKEVEAYKLFEGDEHIIRIVDYMVDGRDKGRSGGIGAQEDAGQKTVYILLPYYRRGNLQDAINANLVNHTRFPEKKLMVLMLGVARALRSMHQYRVRGGSANGGGGENEDRRKRARKTRREAEEEERSDAEREGMTIGGRRRRGQTQEEVEEEPLMDEHGDVQSSQEGVGQGQLRPYSHRDIKPGNIMIDDDGKTPILMDLGSLATSPVAVTSRSLALAIQDTAAEHSTMPYRAPELFDVKTGTIIDGKVDIWSLGCTLYACLVGKSPFEARSEETGGSLSICVLSGDWRFPDEKPGGKGKAGEASKANGTISEPVKDVVRRCLQVEPSERPDVDELIKVLEDVIAVLSEDDGAEDGDEAGP